MARRRRTARTQPPRDETTDLREICTLLARLAALLKQMVHPRATEIDALLAQFDTNPADAWRELDGNAWWAGAGSLAAESLVEPSDLPAEERADAQRTFRGLLIDIAELLRARGPTNPGLSSWLLAFRNWEASGI
jgi:hypothetical protein